MITTYRHVSEPDLWQQEIIVHHNHAMEVLGPTGLRELHDHLSAAWVVVLGWDNIQSSKHMEVKAAQDR